MKARRRRSAWAVFRWPLALAAASLAGLASALLGDEAADLLSWLLLGGLLVVIGLALLNRETPPH